MTASKKSWSDLLLRNKLCLSAFAIKRRRRIIGTVMASCNHVCWEGFGEGVKRGQYPRLDQFPPRRCACQDPRWQIQKWPRSSVSNNFFRDAVDTLIQVTWNIILPTLVHCLSNVRCVVKATLDALQRYLGNVGALLR